MACDGLWDVMDDQYAVDVARSIEDPRRAAVRLRDLAYQTGSTDNISVTVVRIKPANGKPSPAVAFARQRRRSLNSSISLSSSPRRSVADGDEAKMQAHEEQQTVFSVGEPEERDEDLDGSQ
jgi:serine/threonine protein phosphatase PrpC